VGVRTGVEVDMVGVSINANIGVFVCTRVGVGVCKLTEGCISIHDVRNRPNRIKIKNIFFIFLGSHTNYLSGQ
jgi:hypothetical protein